MPEPVEPGCTALHFNIPANAGAREQALLQLRASLASLPQDGWAEIWVDHDTYPSLCAMVSGQHAWLMLLGFDGDAGFSSRNPAYDGAQGATIEFMLSNGQVDAYPASWTYPTATVLRALEYFAVHRKVPGWIDWHNDSGDGSESPNPRGA